ncbi:GNAT family N-acetyltransferase [Microvirga sp. c23x22]|uniref:GNAT family N-acetyltransferase n=2 Tax=Microvirga terricola TaxID=2719797 RepID=A0ABX0VAL8_9HYPH|nr:GNAT family N-acetyltransferase [Microvirga terricola]NIX76874.1 GNAT family N-acetyltransferase [Microvirga terricola]
MPWRPMTPHDLDDVKVLADRIHLDHPEDRDVFVERQAIYPDGCHVLVEGDALIGYALTHPWRFDEPPALNSRLGGIPRDAATYYVHDVALLPEARGKGYAAQAGALLAAHARSAGFANMSLVAVNKSQAFWEKLGFKVRTVPGLQAKLFSYGADAVMMVRELA